MNYVTESLSEIMQDINKQNEALILESLGDLITKGLLVVEQTQPVLVGNHSINEDKYIVRLEQKIRLVLKDKEYIQKLEEENKKLREKIDRFYEFVGEMDY